ncbi:MAG: hypothetical protein IKS96_04045 [Fibrobacter sp.]|nr:hypothetical protein [Fibrobacter sp.]
MGAKILQFVQITKRKRVFLHAETNAEVDSSSEGLFCQINSEFWPHEKAHVSKYFSFAGKYAENERFQKLLAINNFRFLDKQWGCQSYAMTLSKLWNELVIAML